MDVDHAGPSTENGSHLAESATATLSMNESTGPSTNGPSQPGPLTSEPEAGPSRPSRRSPKTQSTSSSAAIPDSLARPASPETALSPQRPVTPHLDLATYPTPTLLRQLAALLQQIALANDQLRPELDDNIEDDDIADHEPEAEAEQGAEENSQHDSRSTQSRSSLRPHPSPTTALFSSTSPTTAKPVASPLDEPLPLFSASRVSLTHPSSLLSFHARHVPSISIEAYLLRILKYCPTTNEVFLGLLVYFDRMSRLGTPNGVGGELAGAKKGIGRGFAIDSFNVHRLVIAGVTVASKFFSDVFYTNSRYAKVGGLPSHELNQLELQFLLLNDFRLVIPPEEMQRYGDRLLGYSEELQADAIETSKSGVASPSKKDKMDVDPPSTTASTSTNTTETSTQTSNSNSTTDIQAPKPIHPESTQAVNVQAGGANGANGSAVKSPQVKERERDSRESRPTSVSFAETHRPHHSSSSSIRQWNNVGSGVTMGEEVMTGPAH